MANTSIENPYKRARENMLAGQLIPNQINDPRLLDAMGKVAREQFLPERLRGRAYADETIYIDANTLIFPPRIFAKLLLAAELKETDFVLDIKSGSGYSAAVIANMTQAVVALENDSSLCETAQQILLDAEVDNVAVLNQPPEDGLPSQGPFDVIFIENVVSHIPEKLLSQLANNGRLICVESNDPSNTGHAVKIIKKGDALSRSALFDLDLSGFPRNRLYKSFIFDTVS